MEVDGNTNHDDETSIRDDGNSNIGDQDTMQVDQNSDSDDGKGIRVTIGVEGEDEVIQEKPLPPPTCCSSQPVELPPGNPVSAFAISLIMVAAMSGEHKFHLQFANLGIIEFHQVVFLICFSFKLMLFSSIYFALVIEDPDPEYYNIEGENGFFKARESPYKRDRPLKLYGYDLYDGFQWSSKGILVYCMIIGKDNRPTGFFLIALGRTRCSKSRLDGFLYHEPSKE